ncbi:MAG: excinuclease ABC subunit UvrB [Patescibacteria group bacterium]
MKFSLVSDFKPSGDQPKAIQQLSDGFSSYPTQTLLGVTGSGKTFAIANVIERLQIPTLVIAHNKTLAAQLYTEFKAFFPQNSVCYFVSYYDYYQPESYMPQTDTYIEKETQINETIERLRMEAAVALMSRKDVIVVASVSCIYGFGDPIDFHQSTYDVTTGESISRRAFMQRLVDLLYERNDLELVPGRFRVRGDTVDVMQGAGGDLFRFTLDGDVIESISLVHALHGTLLESLSHALLFPAKPFIAPEEKRKRAIQSIHQELVEQLPKLGMLEAHRLEQRTNYDLEMMEQLGYCKGIENYSRHFDGRASGEPPSCLLDFFKHSPFSKEFLIMIDESHVTIPQIRGMYGGDYSRKKNLVDYGFRLPSALDNRPLKFQEFEKYLEHGIFVSATPAEYEAIHAGQTVELIVRPTGLVDPPVEIRPMKGSIQDVMGEITKVTKMGHRILVTTLTKRSAEELTEYLVEHDIKARYMHSEVDTLDRTALIKQLRQGVFDVLVGINLLREGLDIPEVGLVAILDADKEGFLRNTTSLIQTIGRAARNVDSYVILYADVLTNSIKQACAETDRRRTLQEKYNKKHSITPRSIKRAIEGDIAPGQDFKKKDVHALKSLAILQQEMQQSVEQLDFEKAIELRDEIAKRSKA